MREFGRYSGTTVSEFNNYWPNYYDNNDNSNENENKDR